MERSEREFTSNSWGLALANIPTSDLRAAYESAASSYTDASLPFGVPQVREGWEKVKLQRQREAKLQEMEAERISAKENMAGRFHCQYCEDRGAQIVRHADGYTSAKPCACRGGAPALTESSGWARNSKGEWYRPDLQPKQTPCPSCGVIREYGRCEQCD